jgi:hypothetical protein
MKTKLLLMALSTFLLCVSDTSSAAETKITGFGSIIGTTLLGDEGYWVKHPSGAGLYDEDVGFDLKEESLLGLQGLIKFNKNLSATAQVIIRGQDDYKPDLEQFFISYDISNHWNMKLGKIRNPVYLFSDSMDIHYSFGWLRTPSTSYSLSASFIEGISAMYVGDFGDISNRTIFYYGRANKNPDPFLTELFTRRNFTSKFGNGEKNPVTGEFYPLVTHENDIQDAFGITSEFYLDDWMLHLAFMEAGGEHDIKTYTNGSTFDELYPNRDFYDIAVRYDDGNWMFIAEWNEYVEVYSSHYITIGKYIDDWQFLLTKGDFNGEVVLSNGFKPPKSGQEYTNTLTASIRYDVTPGMALKTELVYFENKGSLIVTDKDGDGKIEATILSVGFDFVF